MTQYYDETPSLQVLIVTHGHERLDRMPTPPQVPGVSYLVSWQVGPGQKPTPPVNLQRPDIEFSVVNTKGISNNRNNALSQATGDVLLMADDDLVFDPRGLASIIIQFAKHPEIDFALFHHKGCSANGPDREYDISRRLCRNHYTVSFDLAFRRDTVVHRQGHRFNPNFGAGNFDYLSGEEGLLMDQMQRDRTLHGRYFPIDICTHPDDTTSLRLGKDPRVLHSEGAYIARRWRITGFLRLFVKAYRISRVNPGKYLTHLAKGWARATFRPRSLGF